MPDGIPIPFPKKGLSLLVEAEGKPPEKTARCLNARPVDPLTLRNRGAQREGVSKFCTTELPLPTPPSEPADQTDYTGFVQDIASVVYDTPPVTYGEIPGSTLDFEGNAASDGGAPQIEWSDRPSSYRHCYAVQIHPITGDVYAQSDRNKFARYNSDGLVLQQVTVPNLGSDEFIRNIAIDAIGDIYVASGNFGLREGRITKYELGIDDENLTLAWQFDPDGEVVDLKFASDGRLLAGVNSLGAISFIHILSALSATEPVLDESYDAPFPVNQIALNDADEIFIASVPSRGRVTDPGANGVFTSYCGGLADCTPNLTGTGPLAAGFYPTGAQNDESDGLPGPTAWMRADRPLIPFTPGAVPPEGYRFTESWAGTRDKNTGLTVGWGLPRSHQGTGPGPVYRKNAQCRLPAVVFNGDTRLTTGDGQKYAPFAAYANCEGGENNLPTPRWRQLVVMAFRPLSNQPMAIFSNGGNCKERLLINAGIDSATSVGALAFRHENDANDTIVTADAVYTDDNDNFVIVSLLSPGAASTGDKLFMRVNGKTVQWGDLTTGPGLSNLNRRVSLGASHPDFDPSGIHAGDGDPYPGFFTGEFYEFFNIQFKPSATRLETYQMAERIEGYIAHKYQKWCLLPPSSYDRDGSGLAVVSTPSAHPFAVGPLSGTPSTSSPEPSNIHIDDDWETAYGILTKLSSSGERLWTEVGSGVGYAVAVDGTNVFSTGPSYSTGELSGPPSGISPEYSVFRVLIDDGDSFTESGAGTFEISGGAGHEGPGVPSSPYMRMDVDNFGNVYMPIYSSQNTDCIAKYSVASGFEWFKTIRNPNGGAQLAVGYQVAVDKASFDFGGQGIEAPRHLYIGCNAPLSTIDTVYKLDLVSETPIDSSGRERHIIAIAGGSVHRIYPPSRMDDDDAPANCAELVTNGEGALSDLSKIVWTQPAFGQIYITDGFSYKRYNPSDATVYDWIPDSGGSMPVRARILEFWKGRIILARAEGEPHNIYMSAVGEPRDWNLFPRVLKTTSAVNLNTAPRAGLVPDIVNGFIPYSDDLAVIGCDHSIYLMSGDPMAGGQIDVITTKVGMAFGRAWCMDDKGVIYFMSSQGSFYRMVPAPGARPEKLSWEIDGLVQGIDLSRYTCRMVWDARLNGVRIKYTLLNDPQDISVSEPPSGPGPSGGGGGNQNEEFTDPIPGSVPGDGGGPTGLDFTDAGEPQLGSLPGGGPGCGGLNCIHGDWPNAPMTAGPLTRRSVMGWFFHIPTESWWLDRYDTRDIDAQCMTALDGDEPQDRVIVEGALDGYIRYVDYNAKSDDGLKIDSFVYMGPITPRSGWRNVRGSNWQFTMGPDVGASTAAYGIGVQDAGTIVAVEDISASFLALTDGLTAGDNGTLRRRVRGRSLFVRLRNDTLGERWAMESLYCSLNDASRGRTSYDG